MVSRGVFVPVGDGRFYMDVGAADEFKRRRRKTALILVGVVLLLFLLWLIIVMGR
jgi:succinate dehydrogenase/fumarate reductase cytochrome b subunit